MAQKANFALTGKYSEVLHKLAKQEGVSIAEIVRRSLQYRYGVDLEKAGV